MLGAAGVSWRTGGCSQWKECVRFVEFILMAKFSFSLYLSLWRECWWYFFSIEHNSLLFDLKCVGLGLKRDSIKLGLPSS